MFSALLTTRTLCLGRLRLRINPLLACCILIAAAGLCRLGLWQMERAGQKIQQQREMVDLQSAQPQPLEQLVAGNRADGAAHLRNRAVELTGTYLHDRSVFLIYRTYEEQVGYEVLTPLRLEAGTGIVYVSRGWTGAASYEALRDKLPRIEGRVRLTGQIHVPSREVGTQTSAAPDWPLLTREVDIPGLAPFFDAPLFPYVVRLAPAQPGVLVRHWNAVTTGTERHFSYALQWFAMAAAILTTAFILASNLPPLLRERIKPL